MGSLLYKYTSLSTGIRVLAEASLRFTQFGALNDPFESFYPTQTMINPDIVRGFLAQAISDESTIAQLFQR